MSGAAHFCLSFSSKENLCYLIPSHAVASKNKRFASKVLCQLSISLSVANHVAACDVVVGIIDVFRQHSCIRLAHRRIVLRKMAVDHYIIESHALVLKCLQYEVVYRPKGWLWETLCAQAVLVAHHNEAEVEMLANETKVAKHTFGKSQFLEAVYLLVFWFADKGAITVDEKNALLVHCCCVVGLLIGYLLVVINCFLLVCILACYASIRIVNSDVSPNHYIPH